ncbi:MAG: hypothetical protein P8N52_02090, partial [Crocinitomicaceae bacterium]|nr:hypothetical protein [Crocinitomicaceae bacterium]
MSQSLKNRIQELRSESVHFNTNDVLVAVDEDNKQLVFNNNQLRFQRADFPKRILLDAKRNKKESGINSLCETRGVIEHVINGKNVKTPILICPLEVSTNKLKGECVFLRNEEDTFINPFLLRHITANTETKTVYSELEHDALFQELETIGLALDSTVTTIGNFHHHRYYIVKELEELLDLTSPSANVAQLFGEKLDLNLKFEQLTKKKIGASDTDHDLVFEKAAVGNVVIQGPPGTGKSQ